MITTLDAWLWRHGIDHPSLRVVIRNEILFAALILCAGMLLYAVTVWLFWFGLGAACMAWTLWSLSRFFLRHPLGTYSSALLRVVIVRWLGRLIVLGLLFYVALAHGKAPALALAGGIAASGLCAIASYAQAQRHDSGDVSP